MQNISQIVVGREWRNREVLFNEYGVSVSVSDLQKGLEMNGGSGCTT